MFTNPSLLWMLSQARHQEDLKAAERRQLLKLLRQQIASGPSLRQRVNWQVGSWLVEVGRRLQTECEAASAGCYEQPKQVV